MTNFLAGAAAMASAAIAVYFARFWRRSRDRLFAAFALAFFVFAVNQGVISAFRTSDVRLIPYAIRAVAFIVIILAILDKNRSRGG